MITVRTTASGIRLVIPDGDWSALGADAEELVLWLAGAMDGLVALRSGESVPADELRAPISAADHRLMPRLTGIRDALVRAHHAAGGSIGHLAMAMDVPRSTAQYRRDRIIGADPSPWECWATRTEYR